MESASGLTTGAAQIQSKVEPIWIAEVPVPWSFVEYIVSWEVEYVLKFLFDPV